tara:strand:+ start:7299 stop:7868 length:570 start_codon:yes stop_codon:yes gene_type:complete
MEKNTYIIHTQVLESYGDEYEDYKFKFGQTLVVQDATKESAVVLATEMMQNSNNREIIEYPISIVPIQEWYESIVKQPRYKELLDSIPSSIQETDAKWWNTHYGDWEDSFLHELSFTAICTPRKTWLKSQCNSEFMHLNNIRPLLKNLYRDIDVRIANLLYRRSNSDWAKKYDEYGNPIKSCTVNIQKH